MRKIVGKIIVLLSVVLCFTYLNIRGESFKRQIDLTKVEAAESIPVLLNVKNMFEPYVFVNGENRQSYMLKNTSPEYYTQSDPIWSMMEHGKYTMRQTGCVPTSLAIVLQPLLKQKITPVEVATIMYEASFYNNNYYGAGAPAIRYIADYFELESDVLNSAEEVKEALDDGKYVLAAMGPGNFCPIGYTHEIVLYGESEYVNVYDPLDKNKNGHYDVDTLWMQRSNDRLDCLYGSPFFSIYRNTKVNEINNTQDLVEENNVIAN